MKITIKININLLKEFQLLKSLLILLQGTNIYKKKIKNLKMNKSICY